MADDGIPPDRSGKSIKATHQGQAKGPGEETGVSEGRLSSAAGRSPRSILDDIGGRGLCAVVWHATPLPYRLIGFPYGLVVYRRLLAASDTLHYLRAVHAEKCRSSLIFRLLRPRYHKVARLLRDYGFREEGPEQAPESAPGDTRSSIPPPAGQAGPTTDERST